MMAQVILLCGKICSGKSTYALALQKERPSAVRLSCDDLMLVLFPEGAGEYHDMLAYRAQDYLFTLSVEALRAGCDVILDWGFWRKAWRDKARSFFAGHGVPCALHYVDAAPEVWRRHVEARNQAVQDGQTTAYFVDDGLIAKLESLFEAPDPEEIDVLYRPD